MAVPHQKVALIPEQPLELEPGISGVGLKQGNVLLREVGQSQVGGSLLSSALVGGRFSRLYPPVGMYFDGELVGDFLREWLLRQRQLAYGEITHDQYFAWKINWPDTSDRCADSIHYVDWRT